jgi:hypothetical protein
MIIAGVNQTFIDYNTLERKTLRCFKGGERERVYFTELSGSSVPKPVELTTNPNNLISIVSTVRGLRCLSEIQANLVVNPGQQVARMLTPHRNPYLNAYRM